MRWSPDLSHSAPRGPRTHNQLRFSAPVGIFPHQYELLRQGTRDKPPEHVFHHDPVDASVRLAKCSRPTLTQNIGDRLWDLFSISPTNAEMPMSVSNGANVPLSCLTARCRAATRTPPNTGNISGSIARSTIC